MRLTDEQFIRIKDILKNPYSLITYNEETDKMYWKEKLRSSLDKEISSVYTKKIVIENGNMLLTFEYNISNDIVNTEIDYIHGKLLIGDDPIYVTDEQINELFEAFNRSLPVRKKHFETLKEMNINYQ
jgi:hypothetical protein